MPGLQGLLAFGPPYRLQGPLDAAPDHRDLGAGFRACPFLCLALPACRPLFIPAMHNAPRPPRPPRNPNPSEHPYEIELTMLAFALGLGFFWFISLFFS